jgi:hypothetical protein
MSLKNDPRSIAADPQWLPARWNAERGLIEFVYLPRSERAGVTFLSDEYLRPLSPESATVEVARVREALPAPWSSPHFIFHSSFCASTLLGRALDVPGVSSTLLEPQILNDLAEGARRGALPRELLQIVLSLLARPFAQGETVIVKPSNVVNLLAPVIMDIDPAVRAVFLSAPLPRLLKSIADKGLWGRRWARRLYATIAGENGVDLGIGPAELFELTDMQVAALAWIQHHAQQLLLLQRFGPRVRSLGSETFLANRAETLAAAAAHFGLPLDRQQAQQIAAGPVFRAHSKELGRAVAHDQPLTSRESVPIIDEEIEMVSSWAQAVAANAGFSLEMPSEAMLLPA